MDAKEKAQEIVHKYRVLLMNNGGDYVDEFLVSTLSKQCALIAVDEILGQFKWRPKDSLSYWEEVKQEIEKL
jgi:hypothetical protein